jgi:uncharacterized protein (DUF433 family)
LSTTPQPKPHPIHDVDGVLYAPLSRRARIKGTGLEVWEILREYRDCGYNLDCLMDGFHWLTVDQLRAAIRFGELNPEFIAVELAEADAGPERMRELWEKYPFTKPPHLR